MWGLYFNKLSGIQNVLEEDGVSEDEFLDAVNFLALEGYIHLREVSSKHDASLADRAYKTSSQVTVVNNVAPGAPPAISVPNEVKGGASLIVSWSAASDSDGNLSGYILERCINGGTEWTQVYEGNALSYTDAITKGWTKGKYRVKAYDA